MNKKLRTKLLSLPAGPGVYLFRGRDGRIIYAGKAASLRNRVRSYFQKRRPFDPKTGFLVNEIADLEFFPTATEAEAFFLESRFIKAYQPRYNIDLRDDKTFPFVRLTREPFPRIEIVRGRKIKGDFYFGPFTEVWALRKAVRDLRRIFPLAACRRKFVAGNLSRPCLDYNLKRCPGPCAGEISEADYREIVRAALAFFQGRNQAVVRRLKASMEKAAAGLNFERAALLRDEIDALNRIQRHPKTLGREIPSQKAVSDLKDRLNLEREPVRIEACDISNLFGGEAVGSLVTFVAGEPYRQGYRRFKIKETQGIDDCAMLAEVLRRRLSEKNWQLPDLFLIDGGRGQVETAGRTLKTAGVKLPVVGLAKEEERFFVPGQKMPLPLHPFSTEGLFLRRIRDEAHRFAVSYHRRLRARKTTASFLDGIPGIGEKRRTLIWRHFPSLQAIRSAPINELTALGVPEPVARRIKANLAETPALRRS